MEQHTSRYKLVATRWALPVMECLKPGAYPFSELMKELGVSSRMLCRTLKALALEGWVEKSTRPRSVWRLTPSGTEALSRYGLEAQPSDDSNPKVDSGRTVELDENAEW